MMDPKHVKPDVLIELRDQETESWIPLTIVSVTRDKVECVTLAHETILTTISALVTDARLRPRDGSCADCGYEAHDGPCIERVCSECGVEVSSRCSQHPYQAVNVYRRLRYLAEVVAEKPFPTRESCEALRRDFVAQMQTLRNAEQPRPSRVMITVADRADILSALENALALIESLPGGKRRRV
ncbi:MAG TPA: hypothetical protein VLE97_06590 [Gaiellaceae bacterium]|nr:hypothetical protein [Gaiellaceae bacterium]